MSSDICSICNSPRFDSVGACAVCGAAPAAPVRNLPAGTHLQNGRFTLGRVLGEGGFGITYLGAHRHLQRTVAIKELFPEGAVRRGTGVSVPQRQQREFHMERERVLEEARAISRLDSPHIVEVQDVFLENNTAYIVMEYLEGESLQERIDAEGSLPPYDVHRIAMAACDALSEVHRQDLLHRDIKPANIMLTRDGRVVLVDFGSARAFNHGQTVRHTRILTTDYAAPEMYSTQARFGPYTDLFCLGGALFHALIGRQPPSVMDRLQDSSVALEFPDALQSSLSTAICQALEVRVEDRPQSAADFKAACAESSAPSAVVQTDSRQSGKHECTPTSHFPIDTLYGHLDEVCCLAFSPDGQTLAAGGKDNMVLLWNVYIGYLPHAVMEHDGEVHSVAFSPDGQTLAASGQDTKILLWNVDADNRPYTFMEHDGEVHSIAFSPDGQYLASGGDDKTVRLWNVDTGTLRHTFKGHRDDVVSVAFSPNGRILASSGGHDMAIALWDMDTYELLHVLSTDPADVFKLKFSPNGRILASVIRNDIVMSICLWDAYNGSLLHILEGPFGSDEVFVRMAFSLDGRTLASCGSHVHLWDVTTGVHLETLHEPHMPISNDVVFSPDGRLLASCGSLDRAICLWKLHGEHAYLTRLY